MLFDVPQFIDIEDHIVGPLTAKQLGWLGLGGVIIFIFWAILSFPVFIFVAIFIVILFGGLAFYRPYNQPLIIFILSSVGFLFKSKMYTWKRLPEPSQAKKIMAQKESDLRNIAPVRKKVINEKKLEEISKLLDTK